MNARGRSARVRIDVRSVELPHAFQEIAARRRVAAALARETSRSVSELHRELAHFHELDDAVQDRRALVFEYACVRKKDDHVATGWNDHLGAFCKQTFGARVE